MRDGLKLKPHLYGGEQERKRRAGTESVPAIAGFSEAVSIAQARWKRKKNNTSDLKMYCLLFLMKLEYTI